MSSLAASLKRQLALAHEENERHAISLDTVVGALNEALSALEMHEPDFVTAMRSRFGAAQSGGVATAFHSTGEGSGHGG